MKHQRAARIALLSTLAAALAAPVLAQQPSATLNETVSTTTAAPKADAPPPKAERHHGPKGERHGPRGEHHGPRGDRLLHGIELTDAQKTQVAGIREAARAEQREAMTAAMQARKELRDLSAAATFDETRAQQVANTAAAAQAKAAVLRARTDSQILAVLTPEQRTTLETRRKEAEARWEQRRAEREARAQSREAGTPTAPAAAAAPATAPAAPASPAAPATR